MSTPLDGVDDKTTVTGLGLLIKRRSIAMEISYGSGGFCVLIKAPTFTVYGYSWELLDAMQKAFHDLKLAELKILLEDYADDTPTHPELRFNK